MALKPEADLIVPVVEETVHAGKRVVPHERVLLHKTVGERDEAVELALNVETVSIERVPIGRAVSEPPAIREENGVLIVPVLEERLVVEKRLFLVEEVRVRRERKQESTATTVRLRREKVEVERIPLEQQQTEEC